MRWRRIDHGVVIAVLVALALLGVLWFVTEPAAPEPPSGTAALSDGRCLLMAAGHARCSCARMSDGVYTAKHCILDGPPLHLVTINGQPVTEYSLDPTRDLAHIAMWADPSVELGQPRVGDVAQWYGIRHGHAVLRQEQRCGGPFSWPGRHTVAASAWDKWCYAKPASWFPSLDAPRLGEGEGEIRPGDSGAGFYVAGKLVGILSLYNDESCGAYTVRVP